VHLSFAVCMSSLVDECSLSAVRLLLICPCDGSGVNASAVCSLMQTILTDNLDLSELLSAFLLVEWLMGVGVMTSFIV